MTDKSPKESLLYERTACDSVIAVNIPVRKNREYRKMTLAFFFFSFFSLFYRTKVHLEKKKKELLVVIQKLLRNSRCPTLKFACSIEYFLSG